MKILTEQSVTLTTNTFEIETKYGIVIYVEYVNNKNKVIDYNLRSKNTGQEIDDPALLEEIEQFIDSREK